MMLFGRSAETAAVPVGLLTAGIDLINVVKPESRDVEQLVTSFVDRLQYDRTTASALMARIRAAARMFADPRWSTIRRLGHALSLDQRLTFEVVVQRFIAATPLDRKGTFDLTVMFRQMTRALPPSGHG